MQLLLPQYSDIVSAVAFFNCDRLLSTVTALVMLISSFFFSVRHLSRPSSTSLTSSSFFNHTHKYAHAQIRTPGLFEQPVPLPVGADDPLVATVGQDSDWQAALNAARDSVTLLKNVGGLLPLPSTASLLVTGPTCNSLKAQAGGG